MTPDVILEKGAASLSQWGCSMNVSSEGPLKHPGLRMSWTSCCTCHPNIMQWGCRLIAWWLCQHPWCTTASCEAATVACDICLDSHVYAPYMALGYGLPPL